MLSELHFLRPLWFMALAPIGLLLWVLWRRRVGAAIWTRLVDPHLLPHLLVGEEGASRRAPLVLLALGWLILTLALAGPVWRQLPQPVFGASSQRVILLDLSASMNAADVAPSRLARARFEILDLLKAAREGQVALLAFGPEPFLVSPLSADANTIAAQVPQLASDLIPAPGPRRTDLALGMAAGMLERSGGGAGHVILVTDGVGEWPATLEAARRLAAAGHRLSVLAVGTAEGAPVPNPGGGFAQDADGGIQVARLDAGRLRELAEAGKGRYLEASPGDRDTQALIAVLSGSDDAFTATSLVADQWREEGPWLLLVLLPLAALAFRRGWLVPGLMLALLLPADPSLAFGWSDLWLRPDQQGARELASGRAETAAERFRDPAWRAAARYRAGDFAGALAALDGLQGVEPDYNRGNALARLGRLKEAADAYASALRQAPDHPDARHNLELVNKLLEQGKNQEPPPQPDSEASQDPSEQEQQEQQQEDKQEPSDTESADDQAQQQDSGQEGQAPQDGSEGAGEDQKQDAGAPSSPQDKPVGGQEGAASDLAKRQEPVSGTDGSGAATPPPEPNASDLDPNASSAKPSPEATDPGADDAPEASPQALAKPSDEPEDGSPAEAEGGVGSNALSPEAREREQAMEARLRQVPDDPAGLLRQRFLLQHLRREGQLP